ncbi:hypothetical protein [Mesorhizobium sp.]|uniref:DUF7002 family protein n=1 Tax=Mesorhizobium sp. TaxID=1871066 RepID=UPI000FE92AEC|nr:hypothetical protein [Mesorhizobium sp.]RWP09993.1 MAG: hypothetical protein EOQ97_14845 [Mesorhizobium sp.]TIU38896.1 MAG: hypothetical protein E5W26_16020 [Mesorhizobium sp.]
MTEEELVQRYPRLWHMAHSGAWPAIRDYGLMSAAALLNDYGVEGDRRHQLGSCRRPNSIALQAEGRPGTVLRDQKPINDGRLAQCLDDGLTPRDWYELLNSRTFFWLSRSRIWKLLHARAYRDVPQTVLTLDTARLVSAHRDRIWLSPINSGATLFKPQRRGLATFRRIVDFPFEQRAKTRRLEDNVVELVVDHSVPDVADYVLAVHEVRNDQILSEIWRGPEGMPHDHP